MIRLYTPNGLLSTLATLVLVQARGSYESDSIKYEMLKFASRLNVPQVIVVGAI